MVGRILSGSKEGENNEMEIAKKYIDFTHIKKIIKNNNDKEILCFGGGTAAEIMMEQILYRYPVRCFLDNNKELQGKTIHNIPICSPDVLNGMKKGTYFILILSQHVTVISEQLNSFGLQAQKDYYDIYNYFKPYFRISKFENSMIQYYEFLEKIPENYFNDVSIKHGNKIGIICVATMANQSTWFDFTLYLMLKKMGYNVWLVIDCLRGFHDLTYFEGHGELLGKYCQQVLDYMSKRFSGIRYQFINESAKEELNEEDEKEVDRLTEINLTWHHAMIPEWGEGSFIDHKEKYSDILRNNMKVLKYFFNHNSFDSINVLTALHRHRGIYMWEGLRRKMRVSSYDGGEYGTNYPVSYYYDIRKIISENWFSEREKEKIINYAMNIFQKRIGTTSENDVDSFQPATKIQDIKRYDIIMTLNVEWDGPALGLDRIFSSYQEWMSETIEYVKLHTNATMLIREHPIIAQLSDYDNGNWEEWATKRIGNCNRIRFCRYDEKINTYDLISHAKMVLPYSSTTGLEAILLNVPVITHTNVYYDSLECVWSAKDKEDYFLLIENGLKNNLFVDQKKKKIAALAFSFIMNSTNIDIFGEYSTEWYKSTLDELLQRKEVRKILMAIGDNIPTLYLNILELI